MQEQEITELAQRVLELDSNVQYDEDGHITDAWEKEYGDTVVRAAPKLAQAVLDLQEIIEGKKRLLTASRGATETKVAQIVELNEELVEAQAEIERLQALSLDLTKDELLWLMDVANTKDSLAGEVFAKLAEYGRIRYGIEEAPGEKGEG